jgi:RNA polymerase sigma factor (sigma-70 family)
VKHFIFRIFSISILLFTIQASALQAKAKTKSCEEVIINVQVDPLSFYINQIKAHPRLSLAEGIHLAKNMETETLKVLAILDNHPSLFRKIFSEVSDRSKKSKNEAFPKFKDLFEKYRSAVKAFQELDVSQASGIPEVLNGIMISLSNRNPKTLPDDLRIPLKQWNINRSQFALPHLRLVVWVAKGYTNRGFTFLELIQFGNIGFLKAINRYDYRKNLKFPTSAITFIKNAILNAGFGSKSVIHLPHNIWKELSEMRNQLAEAKEKGDADSDLEGIEDNFAATKGRVQKALAIRELSSPNSSFRLSRFRSFEFAGKTGDVIDSSSLTPDAIVESKDMLAFLLRKVSLIGSTKIKPRSWAMVKLYYGLDTGDEGLTLAAIGKIYKVEAERVRQIIQEALGQFRRRLKHTVGNDFQPLYTQNLDITD